MILISDMVLGMSIRAHRRIRFVSVFALSMTLVGCGGNASDDTTNDTAGDATTTSAAPVAPALSVAASFYPVEEIISRIGGDRVEIVRLVEPGDNAHEAELTAKTVEALGAADAIFYLSGGFQASVEKAVESLGDSARTIDLFEADGIDHIDTDNETDNESDVHDHGHGHGGDDPHVWLDPANMAAMARAATAALIELDSAGSAAYAANAEAYVAELDALGREIDTALTTCRTRALVTAHDAFAYLARRAKLDTVAIAGLNPEDEPSARELEKIADAARDNDARTVFFEVSLPEDLARTVADSIGADVDTLDALEGVTQETLTAGGTYSSVMRDNLARIATALGCS